MPRHMLTPSVGQRQRVIGGQTSCIRPASGLAEITKWQMMLIIGIVMTLDNGGVPCKEQI